MGGPIRARLSCRATGSGGEGGVEPEADERWEIDEEKRKRDQ